MLGLERAALQPLDAVGVVHFAARHGERTVTRKRRDAVRGVGVARMVAPSHGGLRRRLMRRAPAPAPPWLASPRPSVARCLARALITRAGMRLVHAIEGARGGRWLAGAVGSAVAMAAAVAVAEPVIDMEV